MTCSRERIISAGFELFETTPFKEVTVEDILKKSYTSRGTFYRYFRDKYELMNLYYSRFLNEDILSEFDGTNWKELQARCYKFGEENSYFFRNVKDTVGQNGFWDYLKDVSCAVFRDIKKHNAKRDKLTDEEEFIIQCYVESAVFGFQQIVFSKTPLSAENVSEIVYNMLPDDYKIYLS